MILRDRTTNSIIWRSEKLGIHFSSLIGALPLIRIKDALSETKEIWSCFDKFIRIYVLDSALK